MRGKRQYLNGDGFRGGNETVSLVARQRKHEEYLFRGGGGEGNEESTYASRKEAGVVLSSGKEIEPVSACVEEAYINT